MPNNPELNLSSLIPVSLEGFSDSQKEQLKKTIVENVRRLHANRAGDGVRFGETGLDNGKMMERVMIIYDTDTGEIQLPPTSDWPDHQYSRFLLNSVFYEDRDTPIGTILIDIPPGQSGVSQISDAISAAVPLIDLDSSTPFPNVEIPIAYTEKPQRLAAWRIRNTVYDCMPNIRVRSVEDLTLGDYLVYAAIEIYNQELKQAKSTK